MSNKLATFEVDKKCFGYGNKEVMRAFRHKLYLYRIKDTKAIPKEMFNLAYDLFYITENQRKSIYELEIKQGIRDKSDVEGLILWKSQL